MTGRRQTRRLLLVAIAVILIAVGGAYRIQKRLLQRQSPSKPTPIPMRLNAAAQEWEHTMYSPPPENRPIMAIRARDFRQVRETGLVELDHVELKIYHQEGDTYDLVKSERAEFQQDKNTLYSEGDVEITKSVPVATGPTNRLVSIRSSGVTFETQTGRASTDKPASFTFENGDGKAVGAVYDPTTKELFMHKDVEVNWRGEGPKAKAMKVEAGSLAYKEAMSVVMLYPWSRLTQGEAKIEAGDTYIMLDEGVIRRVESQKARGAAIYPKQRLDYDADHLTVDFGEGNLISHVMGEPNAHLTSTTATGRTAVSTRRIDLNFDTATGESILKSALASGEGVVEATPLTGSADTRILRAETIETIMRPGGQEIDRIETHSPGQLELIPRLAGHRRRHMDGDRIGIHYGAENRIQSFQSVNVKTRSEPLPGSKNRAPVETWSKSLQADFDPQSGQMTRLEQWGDFRYREAERRAQSDHAVFEQEMDIITLQTGARVWDPQGSTTGDKIRMEQKSGRVVVEGHVTSSRLPDSRDEGLLAGKEPVQGISERMQSDQRNTLVRYQGNAVLWQGANRIQADDVLIDRNQRRLTAHGNVVTQLVDTSQSGSKNTVLTVVQAPDLVYTDADRQALYTGGVALQRPDMSIKSSLLRAILAEQGEDSRIERLFADGQARVVQTAQGRSRTGTGEHAEYYAYEDRMVLKGGSPQFTDSVRGTTRGDELIYFIRDDRLLVSGAPKQRAVSRIPRK